MPRSKRLKPTELRAWREKTRRLNGDRPLPRLGDRFVDENGYRGVVVKISVPEIITLEDHGVIYVWQEDRREYGDDNCEHYAGVSWKELLRPI